MYINLYLGFRNIFIRFNNDAALGDFGISKLCKMLPKNSALDKHSSFSYVGTKCYMSPELELNPDMINPQLDKVESIDIWYLSFFKRFEFKQFIFINYKHFIGHSHV